MTKEQWESLILKNCKDAGTYKPFYNSVIITLAGILERKDAADAAHEAIGTPTVIFSNGNAGCEPNLKVSMELSAQALRYWSELGLTPSSYKKIIVEQPKEENPLFKALKELG